MTAFRTTKHLLNATKAASPTLIPRTNIPGIWQRGISEFFDSDILPQSLGGKPENHHLAWYGDKILNNAVAKSLVDLFGSPLDRGVATHVHSKAVSNSFLRENAPVLIPILYNAQDIQPKLTDNIAGTIVETGVAKLYMNKRRKEIDDLAKFLSKEALIDIVRNKTGTKST